MKRILMFISLLFIMTSCDKYLELKVKFDGKTEILPRSDVMYEDSVIGTVSKVEYDTKTTMVYILISPEYRSRMNTKTMFFKVKENGKENIMVLLNDEDEAKVLTDGDVVEGMEEFMYYVFRVADKVKVKVKEFLESKEWRDFTNMVTEKINKTYNTTKDELDDETKDIRKDIDEFVNKMNDKYGKEIGEKAKEFVDSLFKSKEEK
ncbi:TPA: hypothetical protein DCW38_04985 [candidate division WOR-3 bacterium]|uniref:Mce/MlaD domain-containing protein n=1 Tax=candidate division WOR-3 bacterium TaxID=2052148 RepID=A0A350HAF3_UNCW3|nr:hypothetical protein [candidate division WOR-3 bacterium]